MNKQIKCPCCGKIIEYDKPLQKPQVHRLAVGDCTDKATVDALMMGERAQLVVADPPYGIGKGYQGEDLTGIAFTDFHTRWLGLICQFIESEDTPFYIFAGSKTLFAFADVIRGILSKPRLLIWYRPDGHGAGGSDYFYNFDPLFYGSVSGKIGRFVFADEARDIWIINRARADNIGFAHETEKPLPVIEQPIKASSLLDSIVFDPFLGSGTTLVACERLGRIGRGIEISPAYAAVSIKRWEDLTGEKAILIDKQGSVSLVGN